MSQSFTTAMKLLLRRTLVRLVILIIKVTKGLIGFKYSLEHTAKILPHVGMTSKSHHCFKAHNYLDLTNNKQSCLSSRGTRDLCVVV
jgi:hypothetical protein